MEFKRIFIEKKEDFSSEANLLFREFKDFLGIEGLSKVRIINAYDFINVPEEDRETIIKDLLYDEKLDYYYEDIRLKENEKYMALEYHKTQFNKREDSLNQLVRILCQREDYIIKNSRLIVLENISDQELEKIKSYYINPIEMKEKDLNNIDYLKEEAFTDDEDINDFIDLNFEGLRRFKDDYGLGMDMDDLEFCQTYFRDQEKRNPSITELKLIDTYWSDHCRHTTFMTQIEDIGLEEGRYKDIFQSAIDSYLESRDCVYGKSDRPLSLMDLATINMKEIRKKGLLDDKEETDEINACSIEIDGDVDGENEKWLLMFKNETHNHPTEMEPFGGAATCLGGAIRDPLSGRSYVYQAMRITGSGDPRAKYEDTLPGKLPQRKITKIAKEGYSSYGYEIGAATGYVREIYDPGFVAKRMELGALVAAAPKEAVYRGQALPGDLIILLGGKTGKDGVGGAVGSSKRHTEESMEVSSAEVQKGNPSVERKIIRLFRKPQVSKLIKKCNDFGAGGVSVAIGELADGLYIELDKVPLKYEGLKGSEVALSESQERMALVIGKNDLDTFMKYAEEEDVEASLVARVTEERRLTMVWQDKIIVSIKRDFLDTNGIRKKSQVNISQPKEGSFLDQSLVDKSKTLGENLLNNLDDLNICSQKGLIEGFDHSVGGGTVLMPLGGDRVLTPAEGMVSKIPVLDGDTSTCSIMTYGFEPKLSSWSPFHGGYYAVIESIARFVALGGDYRKIRLSFQEYFERLGNDKDKWGKPFAALLGAFSVQKALDIPSIGGKDSMSGTFENLHVPPSLVSFAVGIENIDNIISPEFKKHYSMVGLLKLDIDSDGLVDFGQLKANYETIKALVDRKEILSMSSVKYGGLGRSLMEMALGNNIGFKSGGYDGIDLFKPLFGSIVIELKGHIPDLLKDKANFYVLGQTMADERLTLENSSLGLREVKERFEKPLNQVFPVKKGSQNNDFGNFNKPSPVKGNHKLVKPRVLIPIFPGTHGEYTMSQRFLEAGGQVETFVFRSLSQELIEESYKDLAKRIRECQILGLPDGAIFGDEPEGSGKLMKIIFANPYVREALIDHLEKKDGLVLGIGGALSGLIKMGLIDEVASISSNVGGEFISRLVDVRVSSNLSPWFNQMEVGDIYSVPLATKEGRVLYPKLNDQVGSQFIENVTGSSFGIDSLSSKDGRVIGFVSAIDRIGKGIYKNINIKTNHKIFEAGVKYFD